MPTQVEIFPARQDNFGYLVHDSATAKTASIDAPDENAIRAALEKTGWTLTDIFITHHHLDHVEAILPLKAEGGVTVTGPKSEADKIEGMDVLVSGGDVVELGDTRFKIYDTPGHTLGHIVYHDPANGHLFSADALFSLGCGRMFEGEPGPMWEGLKALRTLHDDTLIYPGHEYTKANAAFALSIDPNNPELNDRAAEVELQLAGGKHTIPARLGVEKKINPFLRADDPAMAALMGMENAAPAEVFAAIRAAKDNF